MLVKKAQMFPIECIVRGYLTGSVGLFALVWLLWISLPLTWEFVLNRILNAVGERRLARKGS